MRKSRRIGSGAFLGGFVGEYTIEKPLLEALEKFEDQILEDMIRNSNGDMEDYVDEEDEDVIDLDKKTAEKDANEEQPMNEREWAEEVAFQFAKLYVKHIGLKTNCIKVCLDKAGCHLPLVAVIARADLEKGQVITCFDGVDFWICRINSRKLRKMIESVYNTAEWTKIVDAATKSAMMEAIEEEKAAAAAAKATPTAAPSAETQ